MAKGKGSSVRKTQSTARRYSQRNNHLVSSVYEDEPWRKQLQMNPAFRPRVIDHLFTKIRNTTEIDPNGQEQTQKENRYAASQHKSPLITPQSPKPHTGHTADRIPATTEPNDSEQSVTAARDPKLGHHVSQLFASVHQDDGEWARMCREAEKEETLKRNKPPAVKKMLLDPTILPLKVDDQAQGAQQVDRVSQVQPSRYWFQEQQKLLCFKEQASGRKHHPRIVEVIDLTTDEPSSNSSRTIYRKKPDSQTTNLSGYVNPRTRLRSSSPDADGRATSVQYHDEGDDDTPTSNDIIMAYVKSLKRKRMTENDESVEKLSAKKQRP
ncbi:hypothetical protein F5Y19DRAFT_483802 [Xylariaceae sp. FL1651]|nr:hypothetical protein F5Y19DRAFT_483802 [Xylariaceae sp. FL1651]